MFLAYLGFKGSANVLFAAASLRQRALTIDFRGLLETHDVRMADYPCSLYVQGSYCVWSWSCANLTYGQFSVNLTNRRSLIDNNGAVAPDRLRP